MRFTKQKELREAYLNHNKKTKTKFLWLPLTIDGETRWLEKATIEYVVTYNTNLTSDGRNYYWVPWRFINK